MGNGFRISTLTLCVVLAAGSGCRTAAPVPLGLPPAPVAEIVPAAQALPLASPMSDPIIRAGHVVSVRVMSHNRIEVDEKALRVSVSGSVTLPLLRDVRLAGFTLERAKTVLTALYWEYVRNPAVSIDFAMPDRQAEMDSPWGYVTVLGCVKKPGQVSIPPTGRLTVTAAIQAAGGTDTGARTSNVQVSRPSLAEGERTLRLDLHGVVKENRPGGGLLLKNGDVIFVPEGLF